MPLPARSGAAVVGPAGSWNPLRRRTSASAEYDVVRAGARSVIATTGIGVSSEDLAFLGNSRVAVSPGESLGVLLSFGPDLGELRGKKFGMSALQAQNRVQCRKWLRPDLAAIRVYSNRILADQAKVADLGAAAQLTLGKLSHRRRICHVQDHS